MSSKSHDISANIAISVAGLVEKDNRVVVPAVVVPCIVVIVVVGFILSFIAR